MTPTDPSFPDTAAPRNLTVSILMPVRNEALFLREALASITPQPGLDIEVILIDDRSTDETLAIAKDFAAIAPFRMQVLQNPGRGKAAALNHGFPVARGDVFVFLAGDDLIVSETIADRAAAVSGPGMQLAQCRYRSFSDSHPVLAGIDFPRPGRRDHLAGGAVSFNRDFAALYFPIPEELPNEDTWLHAIALIFALPVHFIDRLGLHYRIHAGNSVGPCRSFAETDRNLRRRNPAYAIALDRFRDRAVASGTTRLEALVKGEALRAAGRWPRILALPGLSRGDRVMLLANAQPWLYALKTRLLPRLGRVRRWLGW